MKLIHFTADARGNLGQPLPIKKLIPDWYKDGETYYVDEDEHNNHDHDASNNDEPKQHAGLKTCAPFLDVMISGYALVTPFDIYVGRDESGDLDIKWNAPGDWSDFIAERPSKSGATIPRPAGHLPNHLVWSSRWGWKVPMGYSAIVTHPFNRFDLPFTTMSGLIDSDKFFGNGNIPFFIKEGFFGLIPEGTPFAQVVPVKRKSWKMVVNDSFRSIYYRQGKLVREKENSYKKKMWIRKVYE
jgi:hypothetical protein